MISNVGEPACRKTRSAKRKIVTDGLLTRLNRHGQGIMTWEELIAKAEEYARAAGVPAQRLKRPKVRETAVVTFSSDTASAKSTFHLDASTGDLISADYRLAAIGPLRLDAGHSTRAQAVMALANRESKRLGSAQVGSEHLLVALLAYGHGPGPRALLVAGLEAESVRERIRVIGTTAEVGSEAFGPSLRNVLKLARTYVEALSGKEVEPEHFVLALLDKADGPAMSLLRHFNINIEGAKASVLRALRNGVAE